MRPCCLSFSPCMSIEGASFEETCPESEGASAGPALAVEPLASCTPFPLLALADKLGRAWPLEEPADSCPSLVTPSAETGRGLVGGPSWSTRSMTWS